MENSHFRFLRGDIYFADLNPVRGSEQGGIRPVLVIQNDVGNRYAPTIIISPLTKQIGKKSGQPTHYHVGILPELKYESVILLEQIRTIDKCRALSFCGHLSEVQMQEVDRVLMISLGIQESHWQRK